MELNLDADKFEALQKAFIAEITETIMVKLVEAGLEGQQLEDATASIGFSIASILDDTTRFEADGEVVKPYLTFRGGENELIHCGENAYTYEFMMGVMKKLFHAREG